ncbi:MAG: DegV family protein [Lachnospiraceae bacterium]|nr:DegV family protein [Lachnospiraceae bacterium]
MSNIAIVTDSNSGITQKEAGEMGVYVLAMPFMIEDTIYYEEKNLTQDEFYKKMAEGAAVTTSQPTPDDVCGFWDKLLAKYDEIVYIPMSSGLSGSCQTAQLLAQDYDGRVMVVDNQRISVTQRRSVQDAYFLAREKGMNAAQIKEFLEQDKFHSSIYIMLDTLTYLKRGGRITPAAAAIGNILRLKPVLQIQGEKLDAFAKARTASQGKSMMIGAMKNDIANRFGGSADNVWLYVVHSHNEEGAEAFLSEVQKEFPDHPVELQRLSLSIGCHIGPGALALACSQKISL